MLTNSHVNKMCAWSLLFTMLCVCAKSLQSCTTLCSTMDCSLPCSSVHGILQVRILEWVAMPSSRGSSQSRDGTQVSCIAGVFFTIWATREAHSGIVLNYYTRLFFMACFNYFVHACTCNLKSILYPGKKVKVKVKVAQSCPTLCNPTDCSPPGSPVPEILQVRILE